MYGNNITIQELTREDVMKNKFGVKYENNKFSYMSEQDYYSINNNIFQ